MKKLSLLFVISALVFSGCSLLKNENFEEIQEVDIEISDFVESSDEFNTSTEPENSPSLNTDDITPDNPQYVEKTNDTVFHNNQSNNEVVTKPSDIKAEPIETTLVNTENNNITKTDLTGKIICVDAAHGTFTEAIDENIAPDSDVLKPGNKEGTKGNIYIEDDITLAVANKLKALLESNNATVIMTRTDTVSTMSNKERAIFANDKNADIVIKLHADGTKEGGKGMTVLVPTDAYIKDTELLSNSKKLAKSILSNATKETKAKNRGLYYTSQLSGFNWSNVPVVLFEMGFMTNPDEEILLADATYQDKIANGILNGIFEYFAN